MQAREDFHKAGRARRMGRFAALGLIVSLACAAGEEEAPEPADRTMVAESATVSGPRPPAGHAWVIFGADTVLAEVAASADEREQGLMYRDDVPDGTGMLFVFPDVSVRSFWMANTYVPLDIAFRLKDRLRSGDVQVTVMKGAGHRLSAPHEIDAILRTVALLLEPPR